MQEEPSARIQSAVDEERRRGAAGQRGLITVFGGTGFLGRRIVLYLLDHGFQVRSASRHPERVASASRPDAGPADRAPFLPRFRALALFRRRLLSLWPGSSLPASENLHKLRRTAAAQPLPVNPQQRKCLAAAGPCQCTKSLRDSSLSERLISGRGNQDRDRR